MTGINNLSELYPGLEPTIVETIRRQGTFCGSSPSEPSISRLKKIKKIIKEKLCCCCFKQETPVLSPMPFHRATPLSKIDPKVWEEFRSSKI